MGRSTVHYADNETNNILKALHNKLRPAGTPVQRVEYILELLLLRMFELKLKREEPFKELRTLFDEAHGHQDKLFSYLLTLGSEQILPTLNQDFFPFYAEILKHARLVFSANLDDEVKDQLVLIQEVFANSNFTNNVQSGNLHDVISLVEELDESRLLSSDLLGDAIESALSETGGTKDMGLFRTPDHIRHFMVGLVEPSIEDTMIDPACGTGGFLFDAYEYVIERIKAPYRLEDEEPSFPNNKCHPELRQWFKDYFLENPYPMPSDIQTKQFYRSGIYGIEYLGMIRKMASVNFYVHHLNPALLQQGDALDLFDDDMKESKTLVLANPPFGAEKDKTAYPNVWEDFPKESETTILFVKMMLETLKVGGRCAVIVSEGFLTWEQGSAKALRKMLLQENYLKAVIGLPQGVFVSKGGQGPKTSILLFEKGTPTQHVWFYNVDNDGYSKGTNRSVIEGCQLVEALDLYHQFVKHGELPPEGKRCFSLSVNWLNVVDPRVKAKIRLEVREKMAIKQAVAREKLVVRLDKKLEKAKTAKAGTKTALFDKAAYDLELKQFNQTWENKTQAEIALAIDKAHVYSFNSANYRSSLAESQLVEWDDLVAHHAPDGDVDSLDLRYQALLDGSLVDAIKQIAHFDPKNAIEADIVREFLASIAVEDLQQHSALLKLDAVFRNGAKYPKVKLGGLIVQNTHKVKPANNSDINYKVLGVSNDIGVFINETIKAEETNQSYFVVKKNEFCYNPYRVNVGSIGLNLFDYENQIISGAYVVFETDESLLNSEFLLYLVKSRYFLGYVESKASGGVRMNFTFEHLQDWEIPLPPLEKQLEIVAQVEKQQAFIEGVDKVLENWEIDCLLNGNQYSSVLLGDLVVSSLYGTSEKSEYDEEGYKVLRLGNIKSCGFDLSDVKNVQISEKEYDKFHLKNGDFLIVRSNGNPELVGKSAVWEQEELNFVFASYLIKFRFNHNLVNPKFVMYFLSSTQGKQLLKPQAGGGTYNISSTAFKEIPIPLPDIDEQNLIVNKLDSEMKTLNALQQMKTEAQAKIEKIINAVWESV